jgi:hypothetical protein
VKLSSIVRLLPVLRVRRVGPERTQSELPRNDKDPKATARRRGDAESDAGAGQRNGDHVDTRA